MIPEFIGRLPMVGAVRSLDRDALVRILTEPKNALVKQYQKVFEFEDVELEFTADGLEAVADQALLRGTGARGLRAILEEVLLNTMYDLPGRTDVGKVAHRRRRPCARRSTRRSCPARPAGRRARAGPPAERPRPPRRSTMRYADALAYLDDHASYEKTGRDHVADARADHAARRGDGRSAARVPGDPRHRHQRQGLDGADDHPPADGAGADRRHVHQPAPRARQRAPRAQRRADQRRRLRRADRRRSPTSRR